MGGLFLGFDTSNYTTSAAIYSEDSDCFVLNFKKLLPVAEGERGLRQSEAVFSHVKAAREASDAVRSALKDASGSSVRAVAYSGSPRSVDGSYMPCFLVGEALASSVSAALGVPLFRVSHQDGHVAAAVVSAAHVDSFSVEGFLSRPFISFHVSGGTFEVLRIDPSDLQERIFDVSRVGGTLDASAGQILDRVGVRMGLRFPCGAAIDELALSFNGEIKRDGISVHGTDCNMSGLENRAYKMLDSGADKTEVSAYLLDFISRVVDKLTDSATEDEKLPVIYAGGVMSSKYIRRRLAKRGYFASPDLSSDNAAGVAYLARCLYKKSGGDAV
ncbi:MAG: peptidase M22 [Clostridia bacterium]|nr:peptidase M22 [Clostridia bacterium]